MYVIPLIYGNAVSGTEVSHLWYYDLVYLHFLTFFSFPLAEERGTQQASQEKGLEWVRPGSGVGVGVGLGLGMSGGRERRSKWFG